MRVVITGATGNVGTSLVSALSADADIREIVGVARREPRWRPEKTTWHRADVASDPLEPIFAGADAVVHLAWAIQPSRDQGLMRAINVEGSRRVFEAASAAGVRTLVHASSVGAYMAGPKDRAVAEDWPVEGIPTSFYSRHKVAAERALDELERSAREMRIVRLRPALIFKGESASGIRRLFAGPLLPPFLTDPSKIVAVPAHPRLRLQAVHADDIAQAYRLVVKSSHAHGAYNVAAGPVLDGPEMARALGARAVPVRAGVIRAAAAASYEMRMQPTPPGWVDMAFGVPLLDSTRIRDELGWLPAHTGSEALVELLTGIRDGRGFDTPPLRADAGGPLRVREFLTGVGAKT